MNVNFLSINQLECITLIYQAKDRETKEIIRVYLGRVDKAHDVLIKIYTKRGIDPNLHHFEVNLLQKLSIKPEYFLKYYSSLTEEKNFIMLLEYMPWTLKDWLQHLKESNLAFSRYQIESYMKTLIEAFEYLSKLGIYHKNINPECFMIDSDSNIKITDFRKSVCKNIPENDNNTCQSPIIGNKHYMAPEILSRYGDKETFEYSLEKSDVFSLGLIFLEMITLTDVTSFNKQNKQSDLKLLIDEKTWPFANRILKKMLDFDQSQRYRFSKLLEFFYGASVEYPIGTITDSNSLVLTDMISENPDDSFDYLATYNERKVFIKFFSVTREDHQRQANYLVSSSMALNNKSSCFLNILGAFIENEIIWIVFEDCGLTIEKVLESRSVSYNNFSSEELAIHFKSLLKGLQVCSEKNIFHNNINSRNIFINEFGAIKMLGFSLPFLYRNIEKEIVIKAIKNEETNYIKNFLAPEIIELLILLVHENDGNGFYSLMKADIYSLGIIFYEIQRLSKAEEFNHKKNSVSVKSKIDLINDLWIKELLEGMLDYDPDTRKDVESLLKLIPSLD